MNYFLVYVIFNTISNKINKFRMRILECFTRTIRWVPSVFVTGVVLWSYYAYVVELCIMTVQINWERIVYLTLYHPILFLFVWSYWQTVFTDPLHPRQEYFLTVEEVHKVSSRIPSMRRKFHFNLNCLKDIIVLKNAKKINASQIEDLLMQCLETTGEICVKAKPNDNNYDDVHAFIYSR